MDRFRYLSGWRENDLCCYYCYGRLSSEEINKILSYEGDWVCESK